LRSIFYATTEAGSEYLIYPDNTKLIYHNQYESYLNGTVTGEVSYDTDDAITLGNGNSFNKDNADTWLTS
jgi:hypothetical protein